MAIVNTMEDFIRVMDENPSWRDAVRDRVLTRDLLELPERFAEYARQNNARMDAFEMRVEREFQLVREEIAALRAHVAALETHVAALETHVAALEAQVVELKAQVAALREHVAALEAHVAALERRIGRYEQDMANFRARHASEVVRSQSSPVARYLGCVWVRDLTANDIVLIEDKADTSGIAVNELISFRRADLIMETVRRDTGATCYVAVEISYTVNGRDTRRAIRNAEFLRRFTGEDALAAVSGVRKDYRVDADIDANNVAWYPLEEEDLRSD